MKVTGTIDIGKVMLRKAGKFDKLQVWMNNTQEYSLHIGPGDAILHELDDVETEKLKIALMLLCPDG